jgi:hypothetical protein
MQTLDGLTLPYKSLRLTLLTIIPETQTLTLAGGPCRVAVDSPGDRF